VGLGLLVNRAASGHEPRFSAGVFPGVFWVDRGLSAGLIPRKNKICAFPPATAVLDILRKSSAEYAPRLRRGRATPWRGRTQILICVNREPRASADQSKGYALPRPFSSQISTCEAFARENAWVGPHFPYERSHFSYEQNDFVCKQNRFVAKRTRFVWNWSGFVYEQSPFVCRETLVLRKPNDFPCEQGDAVRKGTRSVDKRNDVACKKSRLLCKQRARCA